MEATALQPTQTKRNLGIELLRCVTMFSIVALHILNAGGLCSAADDAGMLKYSLLFPFATLFSCSVNVYAMISGYVMVGSKWKPQRYLALWLQVVAIGLVMCVLGTVINPASVSWKLWFTSALPATQRAFWYFSAYTVLFLAIPFINRGLDCLNRRQLIFTGILVMALICLSFISECTQRKNAFSFALGYSSLWLICLYLLGAVLRRTELLGRCKTRWLICAVLACVALNLGAMILLKKLPLVFQAHIKLRSYQNPLLVIIGACLVELFSRIELKGRFSAGLVKFLASLTFGVYLIHVHPVCFDRMRGAFAVFANLPVPLMFLAFFGAALGLYLACSLCDWVRLQVFRLLHIPQLCERLTLWAKKITYRLIKGL